MSSTSLTSSALPTTSASTVAGVTHIDLNYAAAMAKGSGSIFITDGAVQTVIDRVTGQPKLRVVGGTYSKEISLDQVSISGTHVMFDATGLPPGAKLNVYMGAGTLTSGGKAAAAITVPDKASFTVPAVTEPPPPPGLTATIAVEDRTLKAGADVKVTVTFSKALATLPFDALSADHASIKGVTHSTDGRTWTITLGAADSIESATNALRLDMSKVSSSDGTHGSGTLTSGNYKVDTVVDAYLFDIVQVNDEGVSDTDGITYVSGAHGDNNQYVAGVLLGELAADEHIELVINGTTVDKTKIHVIGEGDGWGWYYNLEGEADPPLVFNEGTNTITARVVKADGHTSASVTKTVVVDTVKPVVDSSPDGMTNFSPDADIVVTFDQPVYWEYDEGDADMLYLFGSDHSVIEVYLDATNFSEGGQKLTVSAAEHHMQAGVTYSLMLPANLTDLAGNPVFGYEIQFTTAGGTTVPDTTAPHATRVIVEGDGTYKAGETITFRVRFDESVKVITEAIPALGLSNGKKASFHSASGNDLLFKYIVAAGDDTSDLEIADIAELGGTVQDLSNNMLDLLASAHIVHGGIYDNSGYGTMFDVKVDTVAPSAPAAPTLDTDSDSGVDGDGITNDNSPTLTGTAEANARIAIYDGATQIGTTTANSDGVWSTTIGYPTALTDGTYTITVKQTDRAGNVSVASAPFTLVIDTTRPAALAAPVLALESDSGTPGDRITSDDTPTLSGSAEANATVEIYEGDTLLGTGTANGSGAWSATVDAAHALGEGTHNLTVKQVDVAGNRSLVGGAIALTIDKTAPTALTGVTLATDTGISDSDRITNERYAVLKGSGAEPGASIKIMLGDAVVGVGTSDSHGDWTAYFGSPLNEGEHTYKVRQIDAAGHASPDSPSITFTLDRTGPESAPPKPQLAAASDTGASSSDGITKDSTPTFTGSGAMANSQVGLFADEREVGTAVTDASGNWSITISEALSDGYHSIGLKQFDVAGNKSPYSESFNLRVDTHADKLERPVLAAASDSGSSSSDGITNDVTPTFSGTGAEANAGIVLYAGTRVIGSTTADSAGHWELTVLDADKFTADGSYAITAKQTDKAGNTSDASNAFTLVIDTSGPAVTSFMNKTSAREAQLGFSETIVFKPTGLFKLFDAATNILNFSGSTDSNWYVTDGAGGDDSVLNFKISMNGLYNLYMNNEAVQDLAGNVAIIGSPQWVVDLPAPSA